jgi:hypothetical protein
MIPTRADVDGDGREDVVVHDKSTGTVEVYVSKTLADSASPVFERKYTLTHPSRYHELKKVTTGDFDGDGRVDVGAIDDEGTFYLWRRFCCTEAFGEDGRPVDMDVDLLTEVRDAEHAAPREAVTYRRVDAILFAGEASPGYIRTAPPPAPSCSPSSYPTACIRRGDLPVVRSHTRLQPRADAPEATRTLEYGYFYPSADLQGRGFLGFKTIRTWEVEQAVETETTFLHDARVGTRYPYAFLPARALARWSHAAVGAWARGGGREPPRGAAAPRRRDVRGRQRRDRDVRMGGGGRHPRVVARHRLAVGPHLRDRRLLEERAATPHPRSDV